MKTKLILFFITLSFFSISNADVIEKNVITGLTTQRPYTEKELSDIAASITVETQKKVAEEKSLDIAEKREAAIEKMLMSEISTEAMAYQDAIK